ncbi:MAG: hypothetical protein K2O67_01755, partial [Clostridia bacterium]|nr:hypothetical protein [Clostridia bacterium]
KGYKGYASKNDRDHSNPTQNCNTDIWYCTTDTIGSFHNANPELDIVTPYSIDEIRGKLYFPEAGTYNIYLRGRKNCAVYYSIDGGKTYQLGTYIADNQTGSGWRDDKYFTLELKAESWVYFKEVLINEIISPTMAGFIGLGIGQWTAPMFTTEVQYYALVNGARQNLTQETTDDGVVAYYYNSGSDKVYVNASEVRSETHYFTTKNGQKEEVTAEEANDTTLRAPTSISYATAYRQAYEFQKEFESDYFYFGSYDYTYSYVAKPNENATVTGTNVEAYGDSPFENMLIDGALPNTTGKFFAKPGYKFPLEITIDMGHEVAANRFDLFGEYANTVSYYPTKFYVLVGNTPDDITTPFGTHWENVKSDNGRVGFVIDEVLTFRYAKLVIEAYSVSNPQIRNVKFSYTIPGTGKQYSPDDKLFTYKGNWKTESCNSTFGHVYIGNKGTVEFEFEGNKLAIFGSKLYGTNYEVYIDGKLIESDAYIKDDGEYSMSYLSQKLSNGKHKVVI